MLHIFKRHASSVAKPAVQTLTEVNLVGRDYICPRNLTPCEIKSLLWTALDLKHLSKEESDKIPCLNKSNVTVMLDKSSINTQIPIKLGSNFLGANTTLIVDKKWKCDNPFLADFGRLLATTSDLIFCETKEQKIIEHIADGANVPVIAINSSEYNIIKTLADLMTIYERFCRLKFLTVGWIGKPGSLLNTYLLLFPQLKMHFRYCLVDGKCEDKILEDARKYSQCFSAEIHELSFAEEVIYRTNVIVTSAHDDPEFQISQELMREADINWAFLHSLPRGLCDVKSDVMTHKNSLVWKSFENLQWIYAAIIVRFLTAYNHAMPQPDFDSDEYPAK